MSSWGPADWAVVGEMAVGLLVIAVWFLVGFSSALGDTWRFMRSKDPEPDPRDLVPYRRPETTLLDAKGAELGIVRKPGESDWAYRERIVFILQHGRQIPDVEIPHVEVPPMPLVKFRSVNRKSP